GAVVVQPAPASQRRHLLLYRCGGASDRRSGIRGQAVSGSAGQLPRVGGGVPQKSDLALSLGAVAAGGRDGEASACVGRSLAERRREEENVNEMKVEGLSRREGMLVAAVVLVCVVWPCLVITAIATAASRLAGPEQIQTVQPVIASAPSSARS